MNISSMLSADSNANANKVASNKESADSIKVQLLGDVQPPSSPSSSPPESDLPNEHDAEKFTHQSPSAQEQSQSPFPSAISPLNDRSNHVLRANNSSHQPSTLSPLKHLNGSLPSPVSSDSIVSGILPTDYDIPDVSHTPIIDLKYKATFENNINVINKLDHYQLLNHSLKLLKFDEAKLNNYLINTGQFTSNYIDRVVAEDISSRNNKISDTNKNKELNYIDYSKPLHHNSTRGKEFKWGSTREIHKVDHKTRRRRQAASDDTSKATTSINGSNKENAQQVDGTAINNGSIKSDDKTHQDLPVSQSRLTRNHRSQNSLNQLQQQPILIKPKGAGTQGQFELHPRRSTRPKAKRKTFEEEEEAASTVAAATATTAASANSTATAKPDVVEVKVEESQETVTGGDTKRAKIDEDGKAKAVLSPAAAAGMTAKEYKAFMRQYDNTYISIWKDMSRKDGPKVSRLMQQATQAKLINLRKTCILAAREAKRWQLRNTKNQKDLTTKARRAMREMFNFWKRNERIERDLKKKHEKELLDKAKKEEEEREAKRQARKLNFLITQTELYSHFIGKKIKTDEIEGSDADGNFKPQQDRGHLDKYADVDGTASHDINSLDFDNDDEDALHRMAAENAQNALVNAQNKARQFDADEPFKNPDTNGEEMNFQNPTLMGDITVPQPNMLKCTLKEYQLKGLNWLANLYEQGINGILADEMGLGKTVQSISVLSYLAETHNIWGPFLVVTPASTLHNWQQEITKFVPEFKVLPYWGNSKDRKVLRKFWDRKSVRYDKDSPFHVLVTSYQLIVADIAYFQKMKWQYMILDEAQAIKSSSSSRWKSLLSLSCRNRLLLTGTPIQNSMQELWALLHFIMPTLFDSHDEFSDWFSKDIESHAQSNTNLDEKQLRRLHMILKPFMLRRIKKNVQSELGDKVEVDIFCDLTTRQKKLYQQLRSLISILDSDLLDSATSGSDSSLANLVMQFRKVCNHPDLFERADVKSPFSFGKFAETGSFLRESNELEMGYSTENIVEYQLPRLIYDELLCPNYKTNTLESVHEKFNIYSPENTKDLGWLNSINVSQGELNKLSRKDLLTRAIESQSYSNNSDLLGRMNYLYEGDYVPENKKLLITEYNDVPRSNSPALTELYSVVDGVYQDMYMNKLEPASTPLASAPPITLDCSSLHFANRITNLLFDPSIRSALVPLSLSTEVELMKQEVPIDLYPKSNLWPMPTPTTDFSNIRMPSMERFIAECGKLAQLDKLLADLKKDGHRILIYFQMTRMMEIFEEYLCFKKFNFLRLDGSTTIESRRELVTQWQTNSDFFIFMLSTRAGGLGLNLTSADTVIFYDSDWNPTVDAQAMDRAHRIGQTKVVTVYRLLTRNTIEERIRQKAQNKEEIQKLVINQ